VLEYVSYWKEKLDTLLKQNNKFFKTPYKEWLSTSFADGTPFLDGNPIFHGLFEKENKGIRIIQEEPECDDTEISAWIQESEIPGGRHIQELVIALELSEASQAIATRLMKSWIPEGVSAREMQILIDQELSCHRTIFG
jgi:hypothetical protein